jgi:transposase
LATGLEALERYWRPKRRTRPNANPVAGTLHLAQAQSNRGAGGRKRDFPDAERLVKRLVAQELTLSFVPDAEQRLWRTVMRRKYQITRSRVQLHNRLEALLEAVWGSTGEGTRTVTTHIARLRAKLGPAGHQIHPFLRKGSVF